MAADAASGRGDRPATVEIDETGRVDRPVGGRRGRIAVLVVVDQGRAVADDGGHHGVPADPVLEGDRGDRAA